MFHVDDDEDIKNRACIFVRFVKSESHKVIGSSHDLRARTVWKVIFSAFLTWIKEIWFSDVATEDECLWYFPYHYFEGLGNELLSHYFLLSYFIKSINWLNV